MQTSQIRRGTMIENRCFKKGPPRICRAPATVYPNPYKILYFQADGRTWVIACMHFLPLFILWYLLDFFPVVTLEMNRHVSCIPCIFLYVFLHSRNVALILSDDWSSTSIRDYVSCLPSQCRRRPMSIESTYSSTSVYVAAFLWGISGH